MYALRQVPSSEVRTYNQLYSLYSRRPYLTRRTVTKRTALMGERDKVYSQAMEVIKQAGTATPALLVLDIDYTIWPYWCEMYTPGETSAAQLYPQVQAILNACRDCDIAMAVASKTPTPKTASAFLRKLGLTSFFKEILLIPYVGKDVVHFPKLKENLGVPYCNMLFFDDEYPNIQKVSKLGVESVLVSTSKGFCLSEFRKGMEAYARRQTS